MCISKEKKLYVTIWISLLTFSRKISKFPSGIQCQLGTSRVGELRPKLDVCGMGGEGEPDFHTFFADVMNEWPLTKLFFCHWIWFFFFVFLSVFSLCSLIVIFIDFHVKQKRSPQFKKKTRESKFENKAKNTSHTGLVHEID